MTQGDDTFDILEETHTEETEMMAEDDTEEQQFYSEDQIHHVVEDEYVEDDEAEGEEEGEDEGEEEGEGEEEEEEEEDEEDEDEELDGGEVDEQVDGHAEEEEGDDDEEYTEDEFEDAQEVGADVEDNEDMRKLQRDFPILRTGYRLIKQIGEGTFSTVFKAEDLRYHHYDNDWDIGDGSKWSPVPLHKSRDAASPHRRSRFVAIKKIYVTSSPTRILNELELLHTLRRCPSVCPLITAFRHADQVIAVLPYFRHGDFRAYFRDMTSADIVIYLRSLFTALRSVHAHRILHRDIKPTNFLYNPYTQHGVLVDFGLAEREGSENRPCLCHENRELRKHRCANSVWAQTTSAHVAHPRGYPKSDTRPSRRANRAGTRGFRAPEILFKCTEQTTAIDIWSVGVILLTILSKRFPFFNSSDDVEALIEIATIFGSRRMRSAALLHGCVFETTIPTIGQHGFPLEKLILWSTCRGDNRPLAPDEQLCIRFLERCLELDPTRRITAEQALAHEFLAFDSQSSQELGDENEVDMLQA